MIPRLADTLDIVRASMRLKTVFAVSCRETIVPMFSEGTVESDTTEAELVTMIVVMDPEHYRLVN